MKTKARKQGNALMVTLPAALEIDEGSEFLVHKQDNGTILLVLTIDNYF